MKEFIYFPSFSAGSGGNSAKKNFKLNDGTPWRFYSDEYPEKYRHKRFLISAGQHYKKMDYAKDYEFDKDVLVIGDSGGFQIATGVIKWDPSIRSQIFNWLENNSNIALNLDIPTRGVFKGKFQEALDISKENFSYFNKHQSGKTDFLNVLQGYDYNTYSSWYNEIKDYEFQGWAVGGCIGRLPAFINSLCVLKENGEFAKKSNKWFHFLGMSSILEFLVIAQTQKSLNELYPHVQITNDSSTPSNGIRFGNYYTNFNLKQLRFEFINLPRRDKLGVDLANYKMPLTNLITEKIWNTYSLEEFVQWEQPHYGWLINHNFAVFKDAIHVINNIINNDPYIRNEYLTSDTIKLLDLIDQLIKNDNPHGVYVRHRDFFLKMSRLITEQKEEQIEHDYF